jgi:hypothetical protein
VSRSIPRGLSLALALIALAFGVVGVIPLIGLASTYSSWRATSAVVESITFRPVGSNPHGFVFVDFRYESPRGEELTHSSQNCCQGAMGGLHANTPWAHTTSFLWIRFILKGLTCRPPWTTCLVRCSLG